MVQGEISFFHGETILLIRESNVFLWNDLWLWILNRWGGGYSLWLNWISTNSVTWLFMQCCYKISGTFKGGSYNFASCKFKTRWFHLVRYNHYQWVLITEELRIVCELCKSFFGESWWLHTQQVHRIPRWRHRRNFFIATYSWRYFPSNRVGTDSYLFSVELV